MKVGDGGTKWKVAGADGASCSVGGHFYEHSAGSGTQLQDDIEEKSARPKINKHFLQMFETENTQQQPGEEAR